MNIEFNNIPEKFQCFIPISKMKEWVLKSEGHKDKKMHHGGK